ncbi:hypothetical protein K437DRAFT_24060 [Tilletiaria anomala UBC 951]|uniref:Uncharacterized protein n=1 Tax=Tilletiaria anomala (strain ATCC 24038 / CBS 436.72 / UBC 951) TaxID=1037660 RepID=A0A066WMH7_TILAU|nr:uncharacterized protein K437DRAFT_24060 [Tilletiaria anomala UBC 951]KDN52209.1 hypothetical protein K437DRAFT_24060 [Tilletiaria anomala UBC 951]
MPMKGRRGWSGAALCRQGHEPLYRVVGANVTVCVALAVCASRSRCSSAPPVPISDNSGRPGPSSPSSSPLPSPYALREIDGASTCKGRHGIWQ